MTNLIFKNRRVWKVLLKRYLTYIFLVLPTLLNLYFIILLFH